ncbi:MAG: hypothetical protein DRH03_05810 [Deltaproteobacteria bacterium]|nr:MAG: hypothetical protein DRH03_05810 [Deltaproteobacteria bacterium]
MSSYNSNTIYINNRFVQEDQATISPLDTGFLFGDGLFETVRSDDAHPFLLDEHLVRLRQSLQTLAIPEPQNLKQSPDIITELLNKNQLNQVASVIKIVVSRGYSGPGSPDKTPPPTFLIKTSKLDLESIKRRHQGMRALILPWRRDQNHPLTTVKSLNYLENRYALRKAQESGFDEGIFLNQSGELCEGSFSNLFLIRDDSLLTPSLTSGLLPGITRNFILQTAKHLHLDCRETSLVMEDLKRCDGAFLTSSLMEIAPLLEIGKYKFDLKQTSKLQNILREAFKKKREQL